MRVETETHQKVTPPRNGLMHIIDAAGYSLAGLRRLWAETAARLEVVGAALAALGLLAKGAEPWQWCAAAGLFGLVLAVEALNTAIEVLTDHISPEWSVMARDAKDLGSLAVGLILVVASGFVLAVLCGVL